LVLKHFFISWFIFRQNCAYI